MSMLYPAAFISRRSKGFKWEMETKLQLLAQPKPEGLFSVKATILGVARETPAIATERCNVGMIRDALPLINIKEFI